MTDSESRESGQPAGGVVMELARDDCERKKFLKMAGKTMGSAAAATGLAAFIAACGSSKKSSSTSSTPPPGTTGPGAPPPSTTGGGGANMDLAIVNYALTLEYLEASFYKKVIASGLFASSPLLPAVKTFGMEEQDHVDALHKVAMSMGTPAAKPMTKFPLKSAPAVLKLAAAVENLGAAAYLGQAGNIKSKEILASALAIHTVEGRHAAILNLALKKSPTNGAFAKPMTMDEVLPIVMPFIVKPA